MMQENYESGLSTIRVKRYIGFLFLVQLFSVVLGVIFYPYYELLLSQGDFLPMRLTQVLGMFHLENISKAGIEVWLLLKGGKNIVLGLIWSFGGAYLIYYWYKNRPDRCLNLLLKGILASVGVIFLYELIELPYLVGNKTAEQILAAINPYIHQIGSLNNYYIGNSGEAVKAYAWWPPLLWKHQVRSVFPEPSFFGLYCAFAMPWLWYVWLQFRSKDRPLFWIKNIGLMIIMAFLSFLIFATQARTALLLFCGECVLLFIYGIYLRNRDVLRRILIVLVLAAVAFGGSLVFSQFENTGEAQAGIKGSFETYVSQNIASAVDENQRSNRARFSLMKAELKVWMEHPILGVGIGLKSAYIPDRLPQEALKSSEVRMWIQRLHENGALKAGFPDVSEYTSRLCETGLLGSVLYYFPALFLGVYFLKFLWNIRFIQQQQRLQNVVACYFISLAGMLAGGISTSLNVNYCFWILVGVGGVLYKHARASVAAR